MLNSFFKLQLNSRTIIHRKTLVLRNYKININAEKLTFVKYRQPKKNTSVSESKRIVLGGKKSASSLNDQKRRKAAKNDV